MTDQTETTTPVPDLVGLAAADAHDAALDAHLLAIPQNARHTGAGRSTVTGQRPKAGAELPQGSRIQIWVDDPSGPPTDGPEADGPDGGGGGGGGSRVPDNPNPRPTAGAA